MARTFEPQECRQEAGATTKGESVDTLDIEAKAVLHAAEVAGMELPDAVMEAASVMERAGAEYKALPVPADVPALASLIADGADPEKAQKERDRLLLARQKSEELRGAMRSASFVGIRRLNQAVRQDRDEMILGVRPLVTELVERARPLAELLGPFAPRYDAGAIVRNATMEQVEAWRESEELERRFGAILAYWRSAFQTSARSTEARMSSHVRGFDPRWAPQASYYWTWPERVLNPRLNGTYHAPFRTAPSIIRPTILSVACERPECGFRLATLNEVADTYYEANPQARAERDNRQRRVRMI